jgi:osmotically-inducible protein OsmY
MNLLAFSGAEHESSASNHPAAAAREAADRLWRSGYLALRDVSCVALDGVVSLHGCLPSYYLKQVAQEIAAGVDGARCVVNRIEVLATTGRGRRSQRISPSESESEANPPFDVRIHLPELPRTKGIHNNAGLKPQAE